MLNLFKYELFSRWRVILGWGIGLSMFSALYVGVYPSFADQMAAFAQVEFYKLLGMDLASFAGYIASIVIQILPIILGVNVIMLATGTLAGEEDNGTLELVVAMPLHRWQIVAMKTAALLIVILLIMLVFGAGSALVLAVVEATTDVVIDTTPMQLYGALLGAYPLMVAIFGISLFLGTFMPSRRSAMSLMIFIYIASYVINSVGNLVESLHWLRTLSLFSYVNTTVTVFTEGHDVGKSLILLAVGAVFFGLALWSFAGRNITVGQWPWQRSHKPA
ncbi:MAG: ABC transporter permease subunit [Anaerolineae bacterium]|nr:ABC transporter permease subunit [Anaerolineae bacterium]